MFGATLNAHFHFHVVVLDGVFSHASDGEARFHEATGLTPEQEVGHGAKSGNANATYDPPDGFPHLPPPAAITTYWRPSTV